MDSKGSLVFFDYGWDILDMCKDAGFTDAFAEDFYDRERGYIGDAHQLLFSALK